MIYTYFINYMYEDANKKDHLASVVFEWPNKIADSASMGDLELHIKTLYKANKIMIVNIVLLKRKWW